jgi:hypothetical protein
MVYLIVGFGAVVLFLVVKRFGVLMDALPRREDRNGD